MMENKNEMIEFTIDEYRLLDDKGKALYWEWRNKVKEQDKKQITSLYNKIKYANPKRRLEHLQYMREYHKRPEVKERTKEYAREYYKRPEVKEHTKKYAREYYQNPEVKERRRKQYYERKKK